MSGETERNVSGWSVDTLKEYTEALVHGAEKRIQEVIVAAEKANQQRFDAQQQGVKDALTAQKEAVAAALVAAEKAVLVAETNAEKWRMNANEWRGSMLDREAKFAAKDYVDAELKGVRTELGSLKESRAEMAGAVLADSRNTGTNNQQTNSNQWLIGLLVVLILGVMAMGVTILTRLH